MIEVRPVQPMKAFQLISVTLLGMVIEVMLVQLMKASSPMEVTLLGITVFLQPTRSSLVDVSMMALQLFRESKTLLLESTVIDAKAEQPEKVEPLIMVTLLGIVTEVRFVHLSNALTEIVVTLFGIDTEVRALQLLKAHP